MGSESTFEFVRHFFNRAGENKIVLFDPRIGHDDQDINFYGIKWISFNYLREIQGNPREIRHFFNRVWENKIVLFDPRIGHDDQDINFYGIKWISFNY